MNEPALFDVPNKSFPNDVRHHFDGEESSQKAHNVYGMLMSKATYEGVKNIPTPTAPLLSPAPPTPVANAMPPVWTGDNIASWNHLWIANVMTQRLSLSGFSFVGSDIGGFIDPPTPELYVRWINWPSSTFFSAPTALVTTVTRSPGASEEALNIVRKFIKLRYRFLPHLQYFYQYISEGTPMLRPFTPGYR